MASMSWYSSTLMYGHRARSPAAMAGVPASSAADISVRPSKSTRPRRTSSCRRASLPSGSPASCRPSRSDPVSSAATRSRAASSATSNRSGSPASAWYSRRIRRPRPWNVVTVSSPARLAPSPARRSRISWAARRVNVMARNCRAGRPRSRIWWARRRVSVRVLPVPGPAMISSGPAAVAAARCWRSSPSSTDPVPAAAPSAEAPWRRPRLRPRLRRPPRRSRAVAGTPARGQPVRGLRHHGPFGRILFSPAEGGWAGTANSAAPSSSPGWNSRMVPYSPS